MIVVSDTSPLLSLARIGRLDLLERLYHQVLIPPVVFDEIKAGMDHSATTIPFDRIPWIQVARPRDIRHVDRLAADLDRGEAEAIVLAIERRADLVLVDERRGRRAATAAGLVVTGLLGVVVAAKRAGIVTEARPLLDELIQTARFWIGPALYARVLAELGED